jgi:hypothetical protein
MFQGSQATFKPVVVNNDFASRVGFTEVIHFLVPSYASDKVFPMIQRSLPISTQLMYDDGSQSSLLRRCTSAKESHKIDGACREIAEICICIVFLLVSELEGSHIY